MARFWCFLSSLADCPRCLTRLYPTVSMSARMAVGFILSLIAKNVLWETTMSRRILGTAIVTAAALAVAPAQAKDLGAVTALQQTNTLAKSFLKNFIAPANEAGVKIKYIGGQEVVPPRKAAGALKRGTFDVLSAPTAYYIGTVPEGFAMLAANQGPAAMRKNGAWEIMEEVYLKKAGAILLAWGENMTSYNTYLNMKPKMGADGVPDLTGVKMRATGTYRPLFRALGASTINIKSSEIFTAIQRGTVAGFGFPDVAVVAIGLHKAIKYRVTPNYYQTNQVVTVNPASWKALSSGDKKKLKDLAIKYETTSVLWMEKARVAEEKQLKAAGVKDIALKGAAAAKYLDIAHQEIWKQLKAKSEYHDKLKPLMYVPGKPNRQADLGRALRD
ncbi:MAG: Solute-binding protein [Alphaproteobacteria bacterium MarineAlpha11_Bin1]|nr:MAG: Solute-binding protein [Alphaproteobacteria bacterium MarineAlpha11_Bin1]